MTHGSRWVLLGFGEVGHMLATEAFAPAADIDVVVHLAKDRMASEATRRRLAASGLSASHEPSAVRHAAVVLSAVTPAAALPMATAVAPFLDQGTLYVDLNSTTRATALEIAATVEARGARFVDAAIMGAVPVHRRGVPIVLSGPAAPLFHGAAQRLGLNTSILSDAVGDASSLKLLWSVVTKGMIGLLAESLLAAQRLQLLDPLLALLREDFGRYGSDAMIVRMLKSSTRLGERRMQEMRGAYETVASVDIHPRATAATLQWLEQLARLERPVRSDAVREVIAEIDQQWLEPPAQPPAAAEPGG